jgi:RecA-family ATPase
MADGEPSSSPQGDFPVEPLRIVEPITLQGAPIPERQWIVDGLIPRGAVTLLTGDGGTGKSLLAQQLMTCVAMGLDFIGLKTERCRAFGMFCEDDIAELHRRQDDINRGYEIEFGDLENLRWVSRVGDNNLLVIFAANRMGEGTPLFEQLFNAIKQFGATVVIIDTAADTFGGNENVRAEVRQFLSGTLGRLARELDVAIILVSHPSAEGRRSGRGDGGSTAWNNSVRSRLYLSYPQVDDEEARPDPDARILSLQKANYASAGNAIPIRYNSGAFVCEVQNSGGWLSDKIRRENAEIAFIEGLKELASKGQRCNAGKTQQNYAPKLIAKRTTAGEGWSSKELEQAMNRLFKGGRIEIVEDGPPSKRRKFLKVMESAEESGKFEIEN